LLAPFCDAGYTLAAHERDKPRATRSYVTPLYDGQNARAQNTSTFIDGVFAMTNLITAIRQFLASEDGPTAVEYAVLVGLIVVALVSVIINLHNIISGTFSSVSSTLSAS
jgi:pilus assembly protein Flp/PilA